MTTEISKEDARKALNELESSHAVQVAKLRAVIDAPEQKGLWKPKDGGIFYRVLLTGEVDDIHSNNSRMDLVISHGNVFANQESALKASPMMARCNKWIAAGLQADPDAGEWAVGRRWSVWSEYERLEVIVTVHNGAYPVYVHTQSQAEEMRRILIAEGLGK